MCNGKMSPGLRPDVLARRAEKTFPINPVGPPQSSTHYKGLRVERVDQQARRDAERVAGAPDYFNRPGVAALSGFDNFLGARNLLRRIRSIATGERGARCVFLESHFVTRPAFRAGRSERAARANQRVAVGAGVRSLMRYQATTDACAYGEVGENLGVPPRPVNRLGQRRGAHVRFNHRRRDLRKALAYRPPFPLNRVPARDIALEIDQFGHAEAHPLDFHSRLSGPVYQFERERLDVAQHRLSAALGACRQTAVEEQFASQRHDSRGDFGPANINTDRADVISHWSFVICHWAAGLKFKRSAPTVHPPVGYDRADDGDRACVPSGSNQARGSAKKQATIALPSPTRRPPR